MILIQTYTSYEPIELPTHIFCMEVRIEKARTWLPPGKAKHCTGDKSGWEDASGMLFKKRLAIAIE